MPNPFERYLTEEDRIQIGVMQFLAMQYPKALCHHSPNEGKRTPFERFKMKALGVKSGFPDLLIILNGKILALELKTLKGRPTDNQKNWVEQLQANGVTSCVAYGLDNAIEIISTVFRNTKAA